MTTHPHDASPGTTSPVPGEARAPKAPAGTPDSPVVDVPAGQTPDPRFRPPAPGVRPTNGDRLIGLLTITAALIATGVAATGMWRFFGDILHVESVELRAAFFAFLEVAILVSALRARRNLLRDLARLVATGEDTNRASTGVDGAAVWALAVLSGGFSAIDAHSTGEAVFRVAAPLVAAWLWERGLASHRRDARNVRGIRNIKWGDLFHRLLLITRLAEAAEQGATEAWRSRQLGRLANLAYTVHTLTNAGASTRRVRRATRRYNRAIQAANRRFGLAAEDPSLRHQMQLQLAVLYQAVAGTSPAAVAGLSPWGATAVEQGVAPSAADSVTAAVASPDASVTTPVPLRRKPVTRRRTTPVTKPAVAAPTERTDDELLAIVAPLVAGVAEPPSQRALQKAIKSATGAGLSYRRLGLLVERAARESRNGAAQRADDLESHGVPVNGHRPLDLTGVAA